MADGRLQIFDIMACNVYWDFGTPGVGKEQHKFLVALFPTGGAPAPELVERITARGPDGYAVEIANQPFTAANKNGHIYDRTTDAHWYMLNLDAGFMPAGEYTIEVRGRDGSVTTMSRVQEDGPTKAIVEAYVENRQALYDSYSPGQGDVLDEDAPREAVDITWTSLKDLAGQDAYAIFRLSAGSNGLEFDTQNLHWWDNIFLQRATDPTAGLNRDRVTVTSPFARDTPYVYFTELTDGNAMGQTNICVFQPHQSFRA
ncbi:hypothetical protein CLV56_3482 [Mumia flava]|uniref:Uncharacterized protein n=1 Tax=Mumia flava TaxID=1348852 RepID=A0A0B2BC07_9ACTN|nr:hypothetical protein [Mumia flava]PJJ53980.1 hypothetical protein CLV56_3482 [Mumia flava]